MKKFLTLALALVFVLGCVANASALTIGFSQVGQESDWRTANTDSLLAMAKNECWEMVYSDAQQKQENGKACATSSPGRGLHPLHRVVTTAGRGPQGSQRSGDPAAADRPYARLHGIHRLRRRVRR